MERGKEQVKKIFTDVGSFMETDNRAVHFGVYTVALAGLAIAVRKVRPISKFKNPSDVPNLFIKEKRELSGIVKGVNPEGALLMVEHRPLVPIPLLRNGHLPVKISGVEVSSLGISWLQSYVNGSEIKFIPIAKEKNCVQCKVLLPHVTYKNKQQVLNIGELLIKIGFGSIQPNKKLLEDKYYENYYNKLQYAEQAALRKKLGIKYYFQPTILILAAIIKKVNEVLAKIASHAINEIPKIVKS